MTDAVGDTAAAFEPAASRCGVVQRIVQRQLTGMTERTGSSPEVTGTLMADACTIEDPPLLLQREV